MLDYHGVDVRFLVGRNGSGKSTALEALALIFSHLAVGAHPGFDFELEYELRGADVRLATMSAGGEPLGEIHAQRRAPGADDYRSVPLGSSNTALLPDRVIGYSTGPTSSMGDALFQAIQRLEEEIRIEEGADDEELEPSDAARRQREAFMVDPQTLFLDADSSTLPALAALATHGRDELVADVLAAVELHPERPLLSFSLSIASDWDALLPEYEHDRLRAFLELAELGGIMTRVEHADDGGSHLLAAFDLGSSFVQERLPKLTGTPLRFLETLVSWSRRGALQRARLVLRKLDLDEPITDADLSDGELFYLSRYALLRLASETRESLLLLDEPETHFNDSWKIELVEGVIGALDRGAAHARGHQVMIATHSSLTLTDAEPALVQLFVRLDGEVEVHDPPASTFGAAPGDLGQLLFGLDAPVGNFAERTLRGALEHGDPRELRRLASAMGPGYLRLAVQSRLADLDRDRPDSGA
jgi:energy-coupling factor transporter ATP-binding protein EcfA2